MKCDTASVWFSWDTFSGNATILPLRKPSSSGRGLWIGTEASGPIWAHLPDNSTYLISHVSESTCKWILQPPVESPSGCCIGQRRVSLLNLPNFQNYSRIHPKWKKKREIWLKSKIPIALSCSFCSTFWRWWLFPGFWLDDFLLKWN